MAWNGKRLLARASLGVFGAGSVLSGLLLVSGCGKAGSRTDASTVADSPESAPKHVTPNLAGPGPRPALQSSPAPSSKPDLAHSWTLPTPTGVDKNDAEVVELAINDAGTRALAKSKREIYTVDLSGGDVIQTFRPAPSPGTRNPGTERMFLSPDAKLTATWADAPESMKNGEPTFIFQDASSGEVISTAKLERNVSIDFDKATFTPQGNTLLLPGRAHGKVCVQALSAVDGTRKLIDLPVLDGLNGMIRILKPLPGRPAFLVCWSNDRMASKHPSRLSVLDLESRAEQPVQSIDLEPLNGIYDRRMEVSPDGNLVLAQGSGQFPAGTFELGDLQGGAVRIRHSENNVSFPRACFTPDGTRFVLEWGPHFEIMYFNRPPNMPQKERVPSKLQLYEIAGQRKIAEYTPPTAARTLALSGDGKTLAWSHADQVYTIDFQSAFGVPPLPPIFRASDPVLTAK